MLRWFESTRAHQTLLVKTSRVFFLPADVSPRNTGRQNMGLVGLMLVTYIPAISMILPQMAGLA